MWALGEVSPSRGSDISASAFNVRGDGEGVPALRSPSYQPGMLAASPRLRASPYDRQSHTTAGLAVGLSKIHSHKSSPASYFCVGLKSSSHKESKS